MSFNPPLICAPLLSVPVPSLGAPLIPCWVPGFSRLLGLRGLKVPPALGLGNKFASHLNRGVPGIWKNMLLLCSLAFGLS